MGLVFYTPINLNWDISILFHHDCHGPKWAIHHRRTGSRLCMKRWLNHAISAQDKFDCLFWFPSQGEPKREPTYAERQHTHVEKKPAHVGRKPTHVGREPAYVKWCGIPWLQTLNIQIRNAVLTIWASACSLCLIILFCFIWYCLSYRLIFGILILISEDCVG